MFRKTAAAVTICVLVLFAAGVQGCATSAGVRVGVGIYVPGGWVGAGPHGAYPPTVIGRPPVYY